MTPEHLTHDELARLFTAGALVFLGVLQIIKPSCFWGLSIYFRGTRAAFSPEQRERLARVLAARERAEGNTDAYSRLVGVLTIVMAPIALIPAIPFVLPYSISCVAMALSILFSYLRFRRATERRVAPLVRRTVWASLPPLAVAATLVCLAGAALFAAYPQFRAGVLVVIVAAAVLFAVAWRVATAPAILFGDDSQLEYLVDEHLRVSRATNLLALVCAPPTVLVALAWATLPPSAHFFDVVMFTVAAAFVVVIALSLNPIRKRIRIA
jgi:hypothetical protein